jgi:hypothetical protein
VTLTEFLLARIAEDEAAARGVEADLRGEFGHASSELSSDLQPAGTGYMDYPALTIDPTRVLAECEAKRRIVGEAWVDWLRIEGELGRGQSREEMEANGDQPDIVKYLAVVYADHPDYEQPWRPDGVMGTGSTVHQVMDVEPFAVRQDGDMNYDESPSNP